MRSYDTSTASTSFIDIARWIDQKIVSDISSSLRHRMIFINILDGFLGSLDTSGQKSRIVLCCMMDDNFRFVIVNTFRSFQKLPIYTFTNLISRLLIGIGSDQIVISQLQLICLL
jgi:hypothetical protein